MNITENSVVTIHYSLRNDAGEILDSSDGDEPLVYIQGLGQIVPGLERAMLSRKAGDKFDVKIPPAEGYGERIEEALFEVPRSRLLKDVEPEVGMELMSHGPDGSPVALRLVKVGTNSVTLDANHPLAGQNLNFSISVVEVHAASEEELRAATMHGCGCGGCGCDDEEDGECGGCHGGCCGDER